MLHSQFARAGMESALILRDSIMSAPGDEANGLRPAEKAGFPDLAIELEKQSPARSDGRRPLGVRLAAE
jgi:hypothetical protein